MEIGMINFWNDIIGHCTYQRNLLYTEADFGILEFVLRKLFYLFTLIQSTRLFGTLDQCIAKSAIYYLYCRVNVTECNSYAICELRKKFAHAHVRAHTHVCDVRAKSTFECACDVRACGTFIGCVMWDRTFAHFRTFFVDL